jgi:hypothetical protein
MKQGWKISFSNGGLNGRVWGFRFKVSGLGLVWAVPNDSCIVFFKNQAKNWKSGLKIRI